MELVDMNHAWLKVGDLLNRTGMTFRLLQGPSNSYWVAVFYDPVLDLSYVSDPHHFGDIPRALIQIVDKANKGQVI